MKKLYYVIFFWALLGATSAECYDALNVSSMHSSRSCDRVADSLILVNFYMMTNGPEWNTPWNLSEPMETWQGVNLTLEGCVGGLNLNNNNLTGFLPNLNLPALQFINVAENNLFGGIPSFSFSPDLQVLILNKNAFTGFLPNYTSKPFLTRIEATDNLLIGSVPDFQGATSLEVIDLRNNSLSGILPNLGHLISLERFWISFNNLGGNIPDFNLPELRELDMSQNNFFGNIPSFSACFNLRSLNLRFNNLTGNIPAFDNLVLLETLYLDNNNLFGVVPPFHNNASMRQLWLQNNRLSGSIPNFIGMPELEELNLNQNNLSELPAFTGLPNLQFLRVARNMLTFEDLIPNADAAALIFTYTPQDTIGQDTIVRVDLGTIYRLELDFDRDVEGCTYRWYRDNVVISITDEPFIDIPLLSLQDRASYFCVVNNPTLPFLQVVSRTTQFLFNGGSSNDLCALAVDITDLPGNCQQYDFFDVTLDVINGECNFGVYNVWFKFTAKGNRVLANIEQAGFENPFLSIWDFGNGPCLEEMAIEVACGDVVDVDNLIAGKEYYLAAYGIHDGSFTDFVLCFLNNEGSISTPNDFSCNARGIAPNVCLGGNNALADNDMPNPSCEENSVSTVWYKTRLSSRMNTLIIDLRDNNFFGDVSVRVGTFESDSCGGEFVEVPGGNFCQRAGIFQVPNLESGVEYYIQIGTAAINGGSFILCIRETGRQQICGENNSCADTGRNGPIDLPVYTNGGNACYVGCTTDAPPGINQGDNSCNSFYAPTVWFTVTTDEIADFLSLRINSTEMLRPYFSIFRTDDCQNFEPIICKVEGNGAVTLERFPVERKTTYHIAVSDFYGRDGLFTICLSTFSNTSVCNVSNQIIPVSTSMGSPLNGPYRPGEEVSFCYTIDAWSFVSCNWLQAVIPEFGPCWDPSSFDEKGQPVQIDNFFNPFSVGEWVWLDAGEATYNINNLQWGLRQGDPLQAGWYYLNQNSGVPPDQLNVENSLGDGIRCALDAPTWQICFTLKASEELNCSSISNCNFSIKTFTDGEVGGRPRAACLNDVPTFYNAYLDCCNNPVVQEVQDLVICSGEEIAIPLFANDTSVSFNLIITPNSQIEGALPGRVNNEIRQRITNLSKERQQITYTIVPESEGCLGSPVQFEVEVFPEPSAEISLIEDRVCQRNSSTLLFNFEGAPPFEVTYSADGVVQAPLATSGFSLSTVVSPLSTTQYELIRVIGGNDCINEDQGISAQLQVDPLGFFVIDTIICKGEVFEYEDVAYDSTGVFDIIFPESNQFGCDSTVRIQLTVGDVFRDSLRVRICAGGRYTIGNNNLGESGNYVAVLPTQFNCDSIIFLNLRVGAPLIITDTLLMNASGGPNGAISVNIGGGFPPYQFNWSNGSNMPLISGLNAGTYTLTVTDDIDCEEIFEFVIKDLTSTFEARLEGFQAKLFPIPNQTGSTFFLETVSEKSERAELTIRNAAGQIIGRDIMNTVPGTFIHRFSAPDKPGFYLLEIRLEGGRRTSIRMLVI